MTSGEAGVVGSRAQQTVKAWGQAEWELRKPKASMEVLPPPSLTRRSTVQLTRETHSQGVSGGRVGCGVVVVVVVITIVVDEEGGGGGKQHTSYKSGQ